MTKSFPTDDRTKFLIADDVRQEASGKASVIGYYAGDIINLIPGSSYQPNMHQLLAIESLCLFWVFSDGEGDFIVNVSLTNPNGLINSMPPQSITKNSDGEANIVVKISPFVFDTFGIFECRITLDNSRTYVRHFRIINKAVTGSAANTRSTGSRNPNPTENR